MNTRKRSREQAAVRDALNKCTTLSYCYHPIMVSAISYLLLVDCASVAAICREYHAIFWNCLLRNQRYKWCKLHTTIPINLDSLSWLEKYSLMLQHQTLTWKMAIPLDLSSAKLIMFDGVKKCKIPFGVESILLCDCIPSKRLPDHVKRVRTNKWSEVCAFMPDKLERLTMATTKIYFDTFPYLPHLKKLSLHQPHHVEESWVSGIISFIVVGKFIGLRVLVVYGGNVQQLVGLVVHKLVIRMRNLIDISVLKTIKCDEVDLSGCPLIVDFSAVNHISLVIKAQ